jgi:hypothetical protein
MEKWSIRERHGRSSGIFSESPDALYTEWLERLHSYEPFFHIEMDDCQMFTRKPRTTISGSMVGMKNEGRWTMIIYFAIPEHITNVG